MMVEDTQGNLYTDFEFLNKSISEIRVSIQNTEALTKVLNRSLQEMKSISEYKYEYQQLKRSFGFIKKHLPKDCHAIIGNIEERLVRIKTMYEEYFFIQGYKEGKRSSQNNCLKKD